MSDSDPFLRLAMLFLPQRFPHFNIPSSAHQLLLRSARSLITDLKHALGFGDKM